MGRLITFMHKITFSESTLFISVKRGKKLCHSITAAQKSSDYLCLNALSLDDIKTHYLSNCQAKKKFFFKEESIVITCASFGAWHDKGCISITENVNPMSDREWLNTVHR